MLDTKHIFNLTRLGKDAEYLQTMVSNSANIISAHLGSPLVVSKKSFYDENAKSIKALSLFPFKLDQIAGSIYSIDKKHLIVKDGGCFVNNSKIKVIPKFKIDNLSTLLKDVRDNGSITFNISASEYENNVLVPSREKKTATSVCNFLDILYETCGKYKYNSLFFSQYSQNFISPNVNDIYYTASFLDLYNCIPIFNHKKVDGVGVIFNMNLIGSTKASRHLISKACLALILSNYKDNVFITDGILVNKIRPVKPEIIDTIKKIVMANAGVKIKPETKEDEKEVGLTKNWLDTEFTEWGASTSATITVGVDGSGTYYTYGQ